MWFKNLREDIKAAKENDPAARNWFEILLTYSGVHALSWYRVAHFFHKIKLKLIARIISQLGRFFTGVEIHPAAKIEGGVFIDRIFPTEREAQLSLARLGAVTGPEIATRARDQRHDVVAGGDRFFHGGIAGRGRRCLRRARADE